ncbi:MAG: CBS domain-containing protein [Bacteroidota bacterium]|jgi:CBS domain-containing protein
MKVKDILKNKGPEVFTVGEEKSLLEAMKILVVNKIGVLLVLNNSGKIIGILSERDLIRECFNNPGAFANNKVKDAMTKEVIIVESDDDIEYVESIMTKNRIRHLPVVHNNILVGLISIGDIVKSLLTSTLTDNKYLFDYISGGFK